MDGKTLKMMAAQIFDRLWWTNQIREILISVQASGKGVHAYKCGSDARFPLYCRELFFRLCWCLLFGFFFQSRRTSKWCVWRTTCLFSFWNPIQFGWVWELWQTNIMIESSLQLSFDKRRFGHYNVPGTTDTLVPHYQCYYYLYSQFKSSSHPPAMALKITILYHGRTQEAASTTYSSVLLPKAKTPFLLLWPYLSLLLLPANTILETVLTRASRLSALSFFYTLLRLLNNIIAFLSFLSLFLKHHPRQRQSSSQSMIPRSTDRHVLFAISLL